LLTVDTRLEGEGYLGGGNVGGDMELTIGASGAIYSREYQLDLNTGPTTTIDNLGYIVCAGDGPSSTSGMVIESPLDNSGYLVAYSSFLSVDYPVTGPGHIEVENTGTLSLSGAGNENVTFTSGSTGMLVLGNPKSDTGTITGFSKTGTNTLVLANLPFAGTTTGVYTGTTTSGVLTVTEGSNVATINLIGDYLGQTFTLSSYPGGSTEVVDPTRDPAPQLTPSATLSPHTFIAAMAGFTAPSAGASALDSVNRSASPLAVPRSLTA
jgi:hypothetical protein